MGRVVELDPEFALAHGATALGHAAVVYWRIDPTPERMEKAREAADRALAIDPEQHDARTALGSGGGSSGFPLALSPVPITASRDRAQARASFRITVPAAPLRSATVGFPE